MAVTPLDYDDIVDFRYDPFANGGAGEFQPIGIGFASVGYGSKAAEVRQVPNSAPYVIKLYEVPYQLTASATEITKGATTFTEVSQSVTPSSNQYRVVYYDNLAMGQVEFNSAQAGQEVTIKYYGLGHTLQKISLDTRVPDSGNTTIGGIKTFTNTTDSASKDTGAIVVEGGIGVEKIIVNGGGCQRGGNGTTFKESLIEIGNWNMDVNANPTVAPVHGIADFKKIMVVHVLIRNDADTFRYPNSVAGSAVTNDLVCTIRSADFLLTRDPGGFYDNVNFDSDPYNRGWIYFLYEV